MTMIRDGGAWRSPVLLETMPLAVNVADHEFYGNIRSAVLRDLPWLQAKEAHDGHAVLVGGGPSLADTLPELKWRAEQGQTVFAVNNTAHWLIERGIKPDALVILDARASNARFVVPGVKCYLASQCSPDTFEAAAGNDVVLWHPHVEGIKDIIGDRETALIGGGTTVGLQAISIAFALGYRNLHLFGYDSCYRAGHGHAYRQAENENEDIVEIGVSGRWFPCSRWMAHQADEFKGVLAQLVEQDCVVTVSGDGLIPFVTRVMTDSVKPHASNVGTAYYDLNRNPPTYNFLDFLMLAERWRKLEGLERIVVNVLPGPKDGFRDDDLPPYGADERMRWLKNIVLPMARLLPSCGQDAELVSRDDFAEGPQFGRNEYTVGPAVWADAFRNGEYPFISPAKQDGPYVTITLRNTGWWTERSSDLEQWAIVGRALERHGYRVVVIPDGANPERGIDGFESDKSAACNVLDRAALYSGAVMNLGIGNGPMWLSWFMGLPTMVCKIINDNEPCANEAVWRAAGVPVGTQPPKARRGQKLIWDRDRADLILKHFFDYAEKKAA